MKDITNGITPVDGEVLPTTNIVETLTAKFAKQDKYWHTLSTTLNYWTSTPKLDYTFGCYANSGVLGTISYQDFGCAIPITVYEF